MGYANIPSIPVCNVAGNATYEDAVEVITAAGTAQYFYFEVNGAVYPKANLKWTIDAHTTFIAPTPGHVSLYRNGVVLDDQDITAAYVTYTLTALNLTDLKQGDIFFLYVAQTAGAGGNTYSKNRRMYLLESAFRMY